MGIKIIYINGQKVGECLYLRECYTKPGVHQRAMFICKCGNEFETSVTAIKSGKTVSCDCHRSRNSVKHYKYYYQLYTKWLGMRDRCNNINNKAYKNYGGRGISVCDEWDDFKAYYNHVINLKNALKSGLTIDRIKNDEGYYPGNIRWATRKEQNSNRRINGNNTTGYIGVNVSRNMYTASITIDYVKIHIGLYNTTTEAAQARNEYIINNGLTEIYPIQIVK